MNESNIQKTPQENQLTLMGPRPGSGPRRSPAARSGRSPEAVLDDGGGTTALRGPEGYGRTGFRPPPADQGIPPLPGARRGGGPIRVGRGRPGLPYPEAAGPEKRINRGRPPLGATNPGQCGFDRPKSHGTTTLRVGMGAIQPAFQEFRPEIQSHKR